MSEEIKITREEYNHLREWKTRAELRGEKVAELGEQLDAANATIAELREELQECGERIKQEEARANGVGNRIAKEKAEADCKRIRLERDRLTSELATVKRERDEALALQKHTLANVKMWADAAETAHADLATARQALETERAAVEALRGELAEAREQLNVEIPVWMGRAEAYRKEVDALRIAFAEASHSAGPTTVHVEGWKARYASLLTCTQGLAGRLAATNDRIMAGASQPWGEILDANDAALSAFESATKKETEPKQ